ncbi:MAG: GNAT family N-acetyltransferase [Spirochaetales bacterium]|nr:GNAT family N-acetyltransferase [Spirochaetales bacterium]
MSVTFRNFNDEKMFSPDFLMVRDFLMDINRNDLHFSDFTWERWEWIFSLPYMDQSRLSSMGLWEEEKGLVALAAYEESPGRAYFVIRPGYGYLKEEMLSFAEQSLSHEGCLKICLHNGDEDFQRIARRAGYCPTDEREGIAVFDVADSSGGYSLPEGFRVISFAEEYDWKKYNRVLWNGFGHEGEPPETREQRIMREISLSGPHSDPSLKIAVVAPDGNYASFCGMWHEEGTGFCFVEPVATDPLYRRMGCGKAAVLEGIARCARRGAWQALVGSEQLFYYRIGFRPLPAYTFWEKQF